MGLREAGESEISARSLQIKLLLTRKEKKERATQKAGV
jgi:hypothetical protein